MLHAHVLRIRCLQLHHPVIHHRSSASQLTPRTAATYCTRTAGGVDEMGNTSEQHETASVTGDVMTDSFGEGYSTRCDEEGFGGIYGGNQEDPTTTQVKHREFGHLQGSEAAEKEKARHQKREHV